MFINVLTENGDHRDEVSVRHAEAAPVLHHQRELLECARRVAQLLHERDQPLRPLLLHLRVGRRPAHLRNISDPIVDGSPHTR